MNFKSQLNAVMTAFLAPMLLCVAAGSAAEPIPLSTLVAETVAKNPELKFYEAEIAAAKGGRMTAGEWANPELSGELGSKRVHDLAGNKIGDGPVWAVSLSQTFEFPGRISVRKAIANRQVELAQLGLEQFPRGARDAGADARLSAPRGAAALGGGAGSGEALSGFARGAGAARCGGRRADAGDAHHRGECLHVEPASERSARRSTQRPV